MQEVAKAKAKANMKQKTMFLGVIGLALLPLAASAQIYQDVSNSTATVVRDPARQASTEIDAVLFNPAGTALLDDGWHFSLNGKLAYQNFSLGDFHNTVEKSMTDYIPSLQAAYKKDSWAFSLSFGNEGGYGHSTYSEDPMLSRILTNISNQGFDIYKRAMSVFASSCNQYDQLVSKVLVGGNLYNYSARIGAAYQINPHWSVYAGLRLNYVTEKTNVNVNRWVVRSNGEVALANDYFNAVDADFKKAMNEIGQTYETLVELCNSLGIDASDYENMVELSNLVAGMAGEINAKAAKTPYSTILIDERTNGWGISPIIGVDYKIGQFNFAAKYEFETKIHAQGDALSYHIPSILSLGADWQIKDNLKVSLGGTLYHQDYSKAYGRKQMVDLSDDDLYFNLAKATGYASYINTGSNLTSGDISASISFSPIEHLLFSIGYTYDNTLVLMSKSIYPQSIHMGEGLLHTNIISGGLRYDINDKVQLDFGISKKMSYSGYYSTSYSLLGFAKTNVALGINVNL